MRFRRFKARGRMGRKRHIWISFIWKSSAQDKERFLQLQQEDLTLRETKVKRINRFCLFAPWQQCVQVVGCQVPGFTCTNRDWLWKQCTVPWALLCVDIIDEVMTDSKWSMFQLIARNLGNVLIFLLFLPRIRWEIQYHSHVWAFNMKLQLGGS